MSAQPSVKSWQNQIGSQRDWVWRGWKIRYTYFRSPTTDSPESSIPLMFVHGFGSGLGQWRYNFDPISQHHPIYALDLLGFGASQKAIAEYGTDLWVAQIYDFWRLVIGQPVIFIGHSLGALVVLTAASTYPEMTRGLILLTIPPARQDFLAPQWQPLVAKIEGLFSSPLLLWPLFKLLLSRKSVIRSIAKFAYAHADSLTEEAVSIFFLPIQDRGAAQAFAQLARSRARIDFCPSVKELLTNLQHPILLLWGEQDRIVPLTWGRQIAQCHAHLIFIELAAAGHCFYEEYPERVNQEILTWIKKLLIESS